MTAVLLVKTSSLGDVVHNLPVVADILAALGDVAVDWVVERAFAGIPALHPGVRRVIPCEIRRWRRSWSASETRNEWHEFVRQLRAEAYDAVVDTQGLLKSALVARLARGHRYGLDWRSSREPLRFFYDRVFRVPRDMHAVERNRRLCALCLGYELRAPLDYGLRLRGPRPAWLPPGRFVVFLHSTSRADKLWPESAWVELGRRYAAAGCPAVLPWGDAAERERAQRLAAALPGAIVPERLPLDVLAGVFASASAVVGVDTGLTHLAAALDVPVVGIYGTTSPGTTGVLAHGRALNVGSQTGFPELGAVLSALAALRAAPDCLCPTLAP